MNEAVAMASLYGEQHLAREYREMESGERMLRPNKLTEREREVYLGNVEPGKVFLKHVLLNQEIQKVPTTHVFKNL